MAKKEVLVVILALFLVVFADGVPAIYGVCVPVNPNTGAFECGSCEGSEISPAWIDRYNRECSNETDDEEQSINDEFDRCWNGCPNNPDYEYEGECALACNAQYAAAMTAFRQRQASGGGYQQTTGNGGNQQTDPDTILEDPDTILEDPDTILEDPDSGGEIILPRINIEIQQMKNTLNALKQKEQSRNFDAETDLPVIFDTLRKLHGLIDDATQRGADDEVYFLEELRIEYRDLLVRLQSIIQKNIMQKLEVPTSSYADDPNAEILLLSLVGYKKNDPALQPQLDDAKRNLISLLELRDQMRILGEEIVTEIGSEEEINKLREQQDRLFSRYQYEEEELQAFYGRIILQSPHNIEANFALGQLYWDKGYYNIARVFYRRAMFVANVEEAERMQAVMGGNAFRRSVLDEEMAEYADSIWPSEPKNVTEKLERELRNSNTAKRIKRELDEQVLNVPESERASLRNSEILSRAMALSQRAKAAINEKLYETFSEFGEVLYYRTNPLPKEYYENYAMSYHELDSDYGE